MHNAIRCTLCRGVISMVCQSYNGEENKNVNENYSVEEEKFEKKYNRKDISDNVYM